MCYDDNKDFFALYKKVHQLREFPVKRKRQDDTDDNGNKRRKQNEDETCSSHSRHFSNSQRSSDNINHSQQTQDSEESFEVPLTKIEEEILYSIERMLVEPFDCYLNRYNRIQKDLQLKKLATARATEEVSHKTQLRLDDEVPASREHLRDLITAEARKQNKEMMKEMEKMKQQINTLKSSKNGKRGSTNPSASLKKKSSLKQTTTTNKKKRNPSYQKAEGEGNDSQKNKGGKKKNESKRNSGKKKPNVKTKRN